MTNKPNKISISDLEKIADQDGDTNAFFSQQELRHAIQMKKRELGKVIRRNIDYSLEMFDRLGSAADDLNVPVQAIVKLAIQEWLDRRDYVRINGKLGKLPKEKSVDDC